MGQGVAIFDLRFMMAEQLKGFPAVEARPDKAITTCPAIKIPIGKALIENPSNGLFFGDPVANDMLDMVHNRWDVLSILKVE